MISLIDISLSFLEGLALIVSPCILPVLPLVLSTSLDGGKKRPLGIITGFVAAFTVFTLLSRQLVSFLHLNLDYIKYGSLLLLALLGITMLSNYLSTKFNLLTQRFLSIDIHTASDHKNGYVSGIIIGIFIGLVWTPCAGPILAAVLVQVIRQQSNVNALLVVIAFAIGAGVPMLIISLMGRKLMTQLKFLTKHAEMIRKFFGGVILLSVLFIVFNVLNVNAQNVFNAPSSSSNTTIQGGIAMPYKAPDFASSDVWLNTSNDQPITMESLRGKVVLVDFWTYSCINCIRTLPYVTHWYNQYHDQGFVVVGVHAPEFEFEKNEQNVKEAIARYGIKYPVAMDNNLDTWTNFNNAYWPAHYLINKEGEVVYTHFGEGNYQQTENNIRILLGLKKENADRGQSDSPLAYIQTPETYLGYERAAEAFDSPENAEHDASSLYSFPAFLPLNHWALSGKWLINAHYIATASLDTKLQLNFTAQYVYLVLKSATGKPLSVSLKLNGKPIGKAAGADAPKGIVSVSNARLYELVNQHKRANSLLELDMTQPGLQAYAFTFG